MYFIVAALKDEVTELLETEENQLIVCGIGKLNTLMNLTEWFHKQKRPVSCMVNLGTVGSDRIPAGQLVEVAKTFQRDTTFFSEPITIPKTTSLPSVSCGSADSLMPCKENDPWDIVDMELYAIAFFCRQQKIPLVSIKYVTDRNDVSVYKEWKNKLPIASRALSHFWTTEKDAILSKILFDTRS